MNDAAPSERHLTAAQSNAQAPLAGLHGRRPPAPAWFERAMAVAPEERSVSVAGADVEALCWGRVGDPGLLLLHGNGASAHWWSFVAPLLAAGRRVVATSWSGMGGSQWRDAYSVDLYVQEIIEVAAATGLFDADQAPVIVAHSFGGFPSAACAARHGERFGGLAIVDSSIMTPQMREARRRNRPARPQPRPTRVYASYEQALERFRFLPPQGCANLFIADHIARTSLRAVAATDDSPGGWTWRFDPFLWQHYRMGSPTDDLRAARCPVAVVRGERSQLVDAALAEYIASLPPGGAPVIDIPDADHHVMVDQPLAFVAALRALLAPGVGWARRG